MLNSHKYGDSSFVTIKSLNNIFSLPLSLTHSVALALLALVQIEPTIPLFGNRFAVLTLPLNVFALAISVFADLTTDGQINRNKVFNFFFLKTQTYSY